VNKYFIRLTKSQQFIQLLSAVHVIIPYLFVLSFVFILLETYTYPGYLRKVLFINAATFSGLVVLLNFVNVIFSYLFTKKKNLVSYQDKLFFGMNRLLLPVFFFFSLLFEYLEKNNFPNYIFSNYHIHPFNFRLLMLLSIIVVAQENMYKCRKIVLSVVKARMKLEILLSIIVTSIFIWFSVSRLITLFIGVVLHGVYISQHPLLTYEQKMEKSISLFSYYSFVKDHTPTDSTIAVPPQMNPWLTEGNIGYTRYFLYPRHIISGVDPDIIPEGADYAFLAHGEWASPDGLYGWPRATVSAEVVWYFDRNTKVSTDSSDVILDWTSHPETRGSWGLIKLKEK